MRLIDAESLWKAISNVGFPHLNRDGYIERGYVYKLIKEAPTEAVDNYSMGYQDGVRKVLSERQTIFVVTVREEIDGEDVEYRRYFSSEEKAETFINDNLKGQIVMSLSEEEVE